MEDFLNYKNDVTVSEEDKCCVNSEDCVSVLS